MKNLLTPFPAAGLNYSETYSLLACLKRRFIFSKEKRAFIELLNRKLKEYESVRTGFFFHFQNAFRDSLETRTNLPNHPWIKEGEKFLPEERVLIGNRYAVSCQLLALAEKTPENILWFCEKDPFFCKEDYPLRSAQIEFCAPVISRHTPDKEYFRLLNTSEPYKLLIAQLKNQPDFSGSTGENSLALLKALEQATDSPYQVIFIHLDAGADKELIEKSKEIAGHLQTLKNQGKEVYFGVEKSAGELQINDLVSAVKGVLE